MKWLPHCSSSHCTDNDLGHAGVSDLLVTIGKAFTIMNIRTQQITSTLRILLLLSRQGRTLDKALTDLAVNLLVISIWYYIFHILS